jgi:hypothetical protein
MTPPYRSLYTYAWDIADQGVAAFVDDALQLGMRDVTLACSYHAGKFIRPHARQGKRVIFPEDGVVYFEPNAQNYGQIRPQAHSDPEIRQVLPDLIADGRLRVHAWMVLLHNSRLGALHPEYCTRNAFDDPYHYSLCAMHDAVLEYAVALCTDITAQHRLSSIVLETPGWLPYAHGYHHEFAQVESNPWLDHALGLCFCAACVKSGQSSGIDVAGLQTRMQQHIDRCLDCGPSAAMLRHQQAIERDFSEDPDLVRYVAMRQQRVTQLVEAIRQAIPSSVELAVIPSVQRPSSQCWSEGSDLGALANVADYLEIPLYEKSASAVLDDARYCLAHCETKQLRAILRPGYPDLIQGAELMDALAGLQQLKLDQLAFYNYGLLPRYQLTKLAHSLTHL